MFPVIEVWTFLEHSKLISCFPDWKKKLLKNNKHLVMGKLVLFSVDGFVPDHSFQVMSRWLDFMGYII